MAVAACSRSRKGKDKDKGERGQVRGVVTSALMGSGVVARSTVKVMEDTPSAVTYSELDSDAVASSLGTMLLWLLELRLGTKRGCWEFERAPGGQCEGAACQRVASPKLR